MTLEKADFGALEALWRRFYPPKYAVDAALIKQNSVDCPNLDWGASSIYAPDGKVLGFLLIKKSACPILFRGPDPDQAHLTAIAYDDPVVGVDMMAEAKRGLRNRGIYKLVFGQDCRHFFPGCPEECVGLRDFLRVEGFEETAHSFDLERDLSDYEPPAGMLDEREGVEMRPLSKKDKDALSFFLQREFPGRWHYDTMSKAEAEGRYDFILGLFVNGDLHGFALTQDSTQKLPMNGLVWKESLGDHWGGLGPIGISEVIRGKGLGHAILAYSLKNLRERGVKRAIIDWTGLDRFYGAHGFEVTRRYTGLSLRLDG